MLRQIQRYRKPKADVLPTENTNLDIQRAEEESEYRSADPTTNSIF